MEKLKYTSPKLEVMVIEPEEVIAASTIGLGDEENDNPNLHSNDMQPYRTMWGQ